MRGFPAHEIDPEKYVEAAFAVFERLSSRPDFDDLSAYEDAASADIERFLAAHGDIKRTLDAIFVRFKEMTQLCKIARKLEFELKNTLIY